MHQRDDRRLRSKATDASRRLVLACIVLAACGGRGPAASQRAYERGQAAQRAGRYGEATTAYQEAVRLNPDAAPAHTALGSMLYEAGDHEAAVAEHRRALEIDPTLASAHNNLGVALLSTGDVVGAVTAFRAAVASTPEFAAARYNLCLGLELLGQYDEALVNCRLAQASDATLPGLSATIRRVQGKRTGP